MNFRVCSLVPTMHSSLVVQSSDCENTYISLFDRFATNDNVISKVMLATGTRQVSSMSRDSFLT